jgi:hypothetical protein
MFTLNGQVVHVFEAPKGVSKKTGEEYGGQDKVQIMGNMPLTNGQFRMELVTLTTDSGEAFGRLVGEQITVPVAFYVAGKAVGYYIPKGSLPSLALTKHPVAA